MGRHSIRAERGAAKLGGPVRERDRSCRRALALVHDRSGECHALASHGGIGGRTQRGRGGQEVQKHGYNSGGRNAGDDIGLAVPIQIRDRYSFEVAVRDRCNNYSALERAVAVARQHT